MKILVTGGTGMVGKSLQKFLHNAIFLSSKDVDLKDSKESNKIIKHEKPDVVIHLAAKTGGIVDHISKQYDYYYDNVLINTNLIHSCLVNNVEHVISLCSTCCYPSKHDNYPFLEEDIHNGMPEKTNLTYAYAKRMMHVQMNAAVEQFDKKWMTIYAGNLYGPHDSFDINKCHVIPSMIAKMHNVHDKIDLLGDGSALRQFTFVDDLSKFLLKCVEKKVPGNFNFAYPHNVSIKELSEIISDITKYKGKIVFNGNLNGVFRKDVSIEKVIKHFDIDFTEIRDGLEQTYKWYLENS